MEQLLSGLERVTGRPVERISIAPGDFAAFKALYRDERGGIDDQKLLEYYVSWHFLDLSASDTYIDVAAQNCPFAFFLREKLGCKVYRQDLYYMKRGIHGDDIGGDASHLPLQDESVSKISLHSSFEHFEGQSDIGFIREAGRILTVGGKMVIVPLFMEDTFRVETDSGWVDEQGKKQLWGRALASAASTMSSS